MLRAYPEILHVEIITEKTRTLLLRKIIVSVYTIWAKKGIFLMDLPMENAEPIGRQSKKASRLRKVEVTSAPDCVQKTVSLEAIGELAEFLNLHLSRHALYEPRLYGEVAAASFSFKKTVGECPTKSRRRRWRVYQLHSDAPRGRQ
jgi:hypothetical protein